MILFLYVKAKMKRTIKTARKLILNKKIVKNKIVKIFKIIAIIGWM